MDKKVLIRINDLRHYFPVRGNKKITIRPEEWNKETNEYEGRQLFVRANDGVSLDIYEGETLGLVGESGCGKSTLGRVMLQLYKQTAGDIIYYKKEGDGIDLAKLDYNEMRLLRKEMQLIFQDPYSSLNPRMTVGQIIGEGLKAHGVFDKESEEYTEYITDVMDECGLAPYMIHRYPHQFSGGQRQRIGIARSLALRPRFVVCDEAVSALDVSIQSQILNLLQDLKEAENLTYMFISHDLSVVKYISDRIGVMYLGNIVELSDTVRLFENPLHPYTEALLSAIPTTDADRKKEDYILAGDIPSPIKPPPGCKFHTRCRYATDVCKNKVPELRDAGENHFVACHFRGKDAV